MISRHVTSHVHAGEGRQISVAAYIVVTALVTMIIMLVFLQVTAKAVKLL